MVQAAMCSFRQRVESFLEKTGLTDVERLDELRKEIIRLAMQIQDGLGSLRLRKITYDYGCFDEFNYFKNQYLDVSYYLHRKLWKEVVATVKSNKKDLNPDVEYCIHNLSKQDITKLKAKQAFKHLDVDSINLDEWKTGKINKKNLIAYAKSKVHTLSFLGDYDPALDNEDLIQELLCEVVRVFNSYPRSKCKNLPATNEIVTRNCHEKECQSPATHGGKCEQHDLENRVQMYIETALNNKVMNLKEFYTCDSRERVSSTDNKLYKKRAKFRKVIQKDPVIRDLSLEIEALNSVCTGQVDNLHKIINGEPLSSITPTQRSFLDTTTKIVVNKIAEDVTNEIATTKRSHFQHWQLPEIMDSNADVSKKLQKLFNVSGKLVLKSNQPKFKKKISELCGMQSLHSIVSATLEERRTHYGHLINNHSLTKEIQKLNDDISNSGGDYYSKVISLIRPADDDNVEKPLEISHDQVAILTGESDQVFGSVAALETKLWVDDLCERVEPSVARFVRIVTGEQDVEFEKWAKDNHIDTALFVALVNGAKRFTNVKTADLKKNPVILQALKGQNSLRESEVSDSE